MISEFLSKEIGTRFGGSKEEKKAAIFLHEEFSKLTIENIETQKFDFMGWKLTSWPSVEILKPIQRKIPAAPLIYSKKTPKNGIQGILKKAGLMYLTPGMTKWPKFTLFGNNGAELAYIIGRPEGAAIPRSNPSPIFSHTIMVVGSKSLKMLDTWLEKGKTVEVNIKLGSSYQQLSSQNIIATIPGRKNPEETIVVCAHYDSALESPGAVDNASGVEVMFRVAKHLVDAGTKRTIKLITFGCEEWGQLGSKYYVKQLKESGQLDEIKFVLNLDMVGAGSGLHLLVSPRKFMKEMENVMGKIMKDHSDEYYIELGEHIQGLSDQYPFIRESIPAIQFYVWPYHQYHLSADKFENIQESKINATTDIAINVVDYLDSKK
jgi:hypothetical protein